MSINRLCTTHRHSLAFFPLRDVITLRTRTRDISSTIQHPPPLPQAPWIWVSLVTASMNRITSDLMLCQFPDTDLRYWQLSFPVCWNADSWRQLQWCVEDPAALWRGPGEEGLTPANSFCWDPSQQPTLNSSRMSLSIPVDIARNRDKASHQQNPPQIAYLWWKQIIVIILS